MAGVVIVPVLNAQSSDLLTRLEHFNAATVQLIVSDSYTCTGALINNTKDQSRPLIVTAAHCLDGVEDLDSMLVLFGKRKLLKSQLYVGLEWRSKGVSLLSSSEEIDFALLELKSRIPDFVAPVYLGWKKSNSQPEIIYSIHSAEFGDIQYSFSLTRPSVATFGGLYKAIDSGHWRVDQWTRGSTSPGSSGAPLLDAKFRIIGGLSGSTDWPDYKSDYFFRFDLAYDHFSHKDKQLKAWIDPDNIGRAGLYQPAYKIRNYTFNSSVTESIKLVNGELINEEFDVGNRAEINGVYITVGDMNVDSDSKITISVSQNESELYSAETNAPGLTQYSENYIPFVVPIKVGGMISISLRFKTTVSSAYITIPKTSVGEVTSYFMAINSSKP